MSHQHKRILSWAAVVLWATVIFFMSAHTGSDFDGEGPFAVVKRWLVGLVAPVFGPETDVVNVAAHFSEYLVFGVLLFRALFQTLQGKPLWAVSLAAIAIASLYGVTDELHQSFVPGRMCDPADWLTDTLGATLGVGIAVVVQSRRHTESASRK